MTDSLFVNADWSAIVPAGSLEAAFGITPKDAKRRGLLDLDEGETLGEPELLRSANDSEAAPDEASEDASAVAEAEAAGAEPEAKEAAKPADKAALKTRTKAVRKPRAK